MTQSPHCGLSKAMRRNVVETELTPVEARERKSSPKQSTRSSVQTGGPSAAGGEDDSVEVTAKEGHDEVRETAVVLSRPRKA